MTTATLFGPIGAPAKKSRKQRQRIAEAFAAIPLRVLQADIPAAALKLYAALRHYARASDSCWPGQDRLAAIVGCTVRHVRRLLGILQRANLIAVARRGLGLTNRYCLLPTEPNAPPPPPTPPPPPAQKHGPQCPVREDIHVLSERTSMSAPNEVETEKKEKAEVEGGHAAAADIAPLVAVGVAPANASAWTASQPLLAPLEAVQCWQRACLRCRRQNRPEPHPVAFLAALYRDPSRFNFVVEHGKLVEARPTVPKPSLTPVSTMTQPLPVVQDVASALQPPPAMLRAARPEPERPRLSPGAEAWAKLSAADRDAIMAEERRHGLAGLLERCVAAAGRVIARAQAQTVTATA